MNDKIVQVFLECVDRKDCVLEILGNCWDLSFTHPGSHKSAIVTDLFLHSMQK